MFHNNQGIVSMNSPSEPMTMPEGRKWSQDTAESSTEGDQIFYSKPHFDLVLRLERKRTERSKIPFLLLLLDFSTFLEKNHSREAIFKIQFTLTSCLRETDLRGWYEHNRVIGIILTEMTSLDEEIIEVILRKIKTRLTQQLNPELAKTMKASFCVYPETTCKPPSVGTFNIDLYPDMTKPDASRQFSMMIKKTIDLLGSLTALFLFSPVFLVSALAIKATSKGPVFFRQQRMGLNGVNFTLFKFRSMYAENDETKHRKYIEKYIHEQKDSAVEPGVFKLNNDSRVTAVGRFLRKTSLDELPQFINVLRGEMSLVGPRPPIPYEFDMYDIWHRRRLLTCKPGITGLWQVTGRSRTTFDEMARLDLKYINEWSLWLDIKIIFKTPKVMITGKGAY
jgi:exopolysaccharide biosynthesis polyprenyl glycosylphosphotransferase